MPRKNIHLSDSVEKRASELIQCGVADGLSDLIARLIREEFERRFPSKDANAVSREKIQGSNNEVLADESPNDNGKKIEMLRFRCTAELKQRLEKIAKLDRRSPSDLVRIILEDYIANMK